MCSLFLVSSRKKKNQLHQAGEENQGERKTSKMHFLPTKGRCVGGAGGGLQGGRGGFPEGPFPRVTWQTKQTKSDCARSANTAWRQQFPSSGPVPAAPAPRLPHSKALKPQASPGGQEGGFPGRAPESCGTSLTPCYEESSL